MNAYGTMEVLRESLESGNVEAVRDRIEFIKQPIHE
jgi:hypothetical protein